MSAARLIVDGNNVIGSRPDGWWRDRAGAARRLIRALQRLSAGSISYVTLGEATEAIGEYDTVLELEADGGWSWKPVGSDTQPR